MTIDQQTYRQKVKSFLKQRLPKPVLGWLYKVENFKYKIEDVKFRIQRFIIKSVGRIGGGPSRSICYLNEGLDFCPERVILNYHQGIYPMGAGRDIQWHDPKFRGMLPIEEFHVPQKLGNLVRQNKFEIRIDTMFEQVIRACAEVGGKNRKDTWISEPIVDTYIALHNMGVAHSVEAWQDGKLVGGLYGISIGSYWATESLFHTVRDSGKVALVYLFEKLKSSKYTIHDIQQDSDFLKQFGSYSVPQREFKHRLAHALLNDKKFGIAE